MRARENDSRVETQSASHWLNGSEYTEPAGWLRRSKTHALSLGMIHRCVRLEAILSDHDTCRSSLWRWRRHRRFLGRTPCRNRNSATRLAGAGGQVRWNRSTRAHHQSMPKLLDAIHTADKVADHSAEHPQQGKDLQVPRPTTDPRKCRVSGICHQSGRGRADGSNQRCRRHDLTDLTGLSLQCVRDSREA